MKNIKKAIAFTFDDAPSFSDLRDDNPSGIIVDTLKHFGGKGTFFLVGTALEKNGSRLVENALKNGFEVGNHTWSHKKLSEISKQEATEEILKLQNKVKTDFGVDMKFMRPPFCAVNQDVFEITQKLGLPVIHGSKGDGYLCDWTNDTPPEFVKEHCLNNVYSGQIILMHGYSQPTGKCIFEICDCLSKQGYSFLTLSELFAEYYGNTPIPCDRPLDDALLDC